MKRYRPGPVGLPSLIVARLTRALRLWNVSRHVNRSPAWNGYICERRGGLDVAVACKRTVPAPSLIVATSGHGPQLFELRAGAPATAVRKSTAAPSAPAAPRSNAFLTDPLLPGSACPRSSERSTPDPAANDKVQAVRGWWFGRQSSAELCRRAREVPSHRPATTKASNLTASRVERRGDWKPFVSESRVMTGPGCLRGPFRRRRWLLR